MYYLILSKLHAMWIAQCTAICRGYSKIEPPPGETIAHFRVVGYCSAGYALMSLHPVNGHNWQEIWQPNEAHTQTFAQELLWTRSNFYTLIFSCYDMFFTERGFFYKVKKRVRIDVRTVLPLISETDWYGMWSNKWGNNLLCRILQSKLTVAGVHWSNLVLLHTMQMGCSME